MKQTRTSGAAGLGLGCSAFGRDDVAEGDARAVVERALELGVTVFDTAPHYGAGLSERRVGSALQGVPRSSYTLSTKVGRRIEPAPHADEAYLSARGRRTVHTYTPDDAWRTVEGSLARLGTDYIDVLHIHDPLDLPAALTGLVPALLEMQRQGMIRSIGCGMNDVEPLTEMVAGAPLDVAMIASQLNLLDRGAEKRLLPTAVGRGTQIWTAGVYATGLLAGRDSYRYQPATNETIARVDSLRATCAAHGIELKAAAIQMPWRYPGVTRIIVGARGAEELEESVAAASVHIPGAAWEQLGVPRSPT